MGRFAAGLKSLESSQGRALMALAVLITAREHDQQYDWAMNEPGAREDGVSAAVIDIVRLRKPVAELGSRDKEATLIQFGRELFGKHYVTVETYARAKQVFGQRDLSDTVAHPEWLKSSGLDDGVTQYDLARHSRPLDRSTERAAKPAEMKEE